jgi:hypothetical protein
MVGAVIFSQSLRKSANRGESFFICKSFIPSPLYKRFNSSSISSALRLLPLTGMPSAMDFCFLLPFSYVLSSAVYLPFRSNRLPVTIQSPPSKENTRSRVLCDVSIG